MSHARVCRLSYSKGAKAGVIVNPVEGADFLSAIDKSGTVGFRCEVRMVEYVEILNAKLKSIAFRDVEVFGDLHVGIPGVRQTEEVLAYIADGAGAVASRRELPVDCGGGQKRRRIEPALAGYGHSSTGG